jgi:hypothetical protein
MTHTRLLQVTTAAMGGLTSVFRCYCWQAGPTTVATKVVHRRVMKTTCEIGSVKFSMKYCSPNLKHSSFDLYEQYPVFTGFLKPAMNRASSNGRLHHGARCYMTRSQ